MTERSAFPRLGLVDNSTGTPIDTGDDGLTARELLTAIVASGLVSGGYAWADTAVTTAKAEEVADAILKTPKP